MSDRVDIEKFNETAVAAMFKELKQLKDGSVPGNPVVIQMNAKQ